MKAVNEQSNMQRIFANLKRLAALHIEYAKLTMAEKVTVILSTMAFYALVVVFGALALVFLTIGVGWLLATSIAPHFAFMIVAGFYIILLALLIAFRKKIFVNPISRFISKLFLNPPEESNIYEKRDDK